MGVIITLCIPICHSGEDRNPVGKIRNPKHEIRNNIKIQNIKIKNKYISDWIPAFAGMTNEKEASVIQQYD
jgi:uncharacterized protein YegJ (DUF2314 family)